MAFEKKNGLFHELRTFAPRDGHAVDLFEEEKVIFLVLLGRIGSHTSAHPPWADLPPLLHVHTPCLQKEAQWESTAAR